MKGHYHFQSPLIRSLRSRSFSVIKDFLGGQNANTLVTNRMPFDTYNLSAELRISKGVMKGQCLFMSLSQ